MLDVGAAWWHRLDVRLALAVVLVMGVLAAAWVGWQASANQRLHDGLTQHHSLGLARYIAERQSQAFFDAEGRLRPDALANTAMYIEMVQPSLEAYLLDLNGRVLQHSLRQPPQLMQVDLAPVLPLLGPAPVALPLYGQDPNRPEQPNLVSLAPLPTARAPQAYLYVVLRGAQAAQLEQQEMAALQRQAFWGLGLLALGLAAAVIVLAQWLLTRRLRRLAHGLQAFRQPDGEPLAHLPAGGDEVTLVAAAAQALQDRVAQQFRRQEDNERLLRELIGNVSHDLHTPLANVQGYVETLLLNDAQLDVATRAQYLRTSLHHCQRLSRRVAELFELSKLQTGQTQAQFEPFCMAELLSDVVQHQQLSAQRVGLTLRLGADVDRSARVHADIGLIERVLQNLVDNAIGHTQPGGLVELSVLCQGQQVLVRVRDNGCGIAEPDQARIFDRYWSTRLATERTAQPATSGGLGLAIVTRILALHGSAVAVRSAQFEGSEFSFCLPAA